VGSILGKWKGKPGFGGAQNLSKKTSKKPATWRPSFVLLYDMGRKGREESERALRKELEQIRAENVALRAVKKELQKQLDLLQEKLRILLHKQFGRKSEKLEHPGQLLLFDPPEEEIQKPPFVDEAPDEEYETITRKKGRRRGPRALKTLPQKEILLEIPEEERLCPCCHEPMTVIGADRQVKFSFVPSVAMEVITIRPKYACKKHEESGVVQAPLPPSPIEKSKAGPSLLAHVLVSKYNDHLPLHRLMGIYRRHGLEIGDGILCDWVRKCAELLAPIRDEMCKQIKKDNLVYSDDTPITVLDHSLPKGSRKSYLWVYLDSVGNAVFDFTRGRSREGPLKWIEGYRGDLVADAYSGYDRIFWGEGVNEVGCWAHARRKFHDAFRAGDERGHFAVQVIQGMYRLERQATKKGYDHKSRRLMRETKTREIVEKFFDWILSLQKELIPGSLMAKAVGYALNQQKALMRFLENGRLPLDNNYAERTLRHVAVGRKNWMFAGSYQGGERAAVLYSLLMTCRHLEMDPLEYMTDVLGRIRTQDPSRMEDLTPMVWKAKRKEMVGTA
jgi:transposase